MMITKKGMTLFYGRDCVLSNWHPAPFVYRGVAFLQTEQFMMYCKARLFKDLDAAQKILQVDEPKDHKALGRHVRGFSQAIWDAKCEGYVFVGCKAKFEQHPAMAEVLLNTDDTELVEASPFDRIWGVGLSASDPRIWDKSQWRGRDLLGQVLMRVRSSLRQDLSTDRLMQTEVSSGSSKGCSPQA